MFFFYTFLRVLVDYWCNRRAKPLTGRLNKHAGTILLKLSASKVPYNLALCPKGSPFRNFQSVGNLQSIYFVYLTLNRALLMYSLPLFTVFSPLCYQLPNGTVKHPKKAILTENTKQSLFRAGPIWLCFYFPSPLSILNPWNFGPFHILFLYWFGLFTTADFRSTSHVCEWISFHGFGNHHSSKVFSCSNAVSLLPLIWKFY